MSGWDSHAENVVTNVKRKATATEVQAVIACNTSGAIWGKTTDSITQNDVQNILSGMAIKDSFFASGVNFQNLKYLCLKQEEQEVIFKKGKKGLIAVKTKSTIIVVSFEGESAEGPVFSALEEPVKYITDSNY